MKASHTLLFLLLQSLLFSQTVRFEVSGMNESKAYIFSLSGEKTSFMDSVLSTDKTNFTLTIDPSRYPSGFYRFICKNTLIDFVYDGKNIVLKTNAKYPADSMSVIASESNVLYYRFLKLNRAYKTKSELLFLMLSKFPKDDDYYQTTKNKLLSLQKEYSDFVNYQSQKEPKSLVSRYIRSAQFPLVDSELPPEKQLAFLRAHALDHVDFSDAELTLSGLFSDKVIEYLMYYRNPQLTKEQLEKEFQAAVDSVLIKARKDTYVYQHVTEYLVDGFKKFGFDEVVDYIIENYVIKDDICLNEKLETTLQLRMQQAKRFKIGAIVPDITLQTTDEKDIQLSKIQSKKILLVFYASWCPHCKEMLPKLAQLYNEQSKEKFEVVAVSLDTSKTDWQKFTSENNFKWINASDLKGWSGNAAKDFSIYATPTMFLINNKLELLAKPANPEDVKKFLP
jgi:peroxiredoxin